MTVSQTLRTRPREREMPPADRMSIAFLAPHVADLSTTQIAAPATGFIPAPAGSFPLATSLRSPESPPSSIEAYPAGSQDPKSRPIQQLCEGTVRDYINASRGRKCTRSRSRENVVTKPHCRHGRQPSSSESSSNDESSSSGNFKRQPRSPRPTYSEEQRFFVMYARLVQDKSWPDIEEDFATIFKQRSKGGLCSLYYRVRRSWGLEDVLKSDTNYWAKERRIVDEKAFYHAQDFLLSIGYLRRT